MSYREKEFLDLLERRASENRTASDKWGELTPLVRQWAGYAGVNPWRVIVPMSIGFSFVAAWWWRGDWVALASWLQGMF